MRPAPKSRVIARLERELASARCDRDKAVRSAGRFMAEKSELHEALRPLAKLWAQHRTAKGAAARDEALQAMQLALGGEVFRRAFEVVDLDSPEPRIIVL